MATKTLISYIVLSYLCLGICHGAKSFKMNAQTEDTTWCVARTAMPNDKLQAYIDFACAKIDCGPIRPGGSCFTPDTLENHASYALDAYFRSTGVCDATIGTPAVTDPSWGSCHYP